MSSMAAKPESSASGRIFRFGAFEFHVQARELRKHGLRIRLNGQPINVLAMLLERPGEVVTREDLQVRLWPAGTYVDFEHSLNAAVKRLRQALGDSADSPRFIETLARSGYRFIAPLSERIDDLAERVGQKHAEEPQSAAQAQETPKWLRFFSFPRVIAGLLLLIVIAGLVIALHERRPTHAGFWPSPVFSRSPFGQSFRRSRRGVFRGRDGRCASTAPRGH